MHTNKAHPLQHTKCLNMFKCFKMCLILQVMLNRFFYRLTHPMLGTTTAVFVDKNRGSAGIEGLLAE